VTLVLISTAALAFSEALGVTLARELKIVTEVADPALDVVPVARRLPPDVVVLQAHVPAGPLLARGLCVVSRDIRVIALVIGELEEDVRAWASVGVAACLAPTDSMTDIIDATRTVIAGESFCSPRLAGALFRGYSFPQTGEGIYGRLTNREVEMVGLLARGLSNKEIAQHLHVQVTTVKNHLHSLYAKTGVHGRDELRVRLERAPSLKLGPS
jgi:DNA-binding NarL/FixJ family response regulator